MKNKKIFIGLAISLLSLVTSCRSEESLSQNETAITDLQRLLSN
jgi:hypothetical protein